MNCGVGHRCGLDLVVLWLWSRPAAVAPIRRLAWELPHAAGVVQGVKGEEIAVIRTDEGGSGRKRDRKQRI